MQSLDFSTEWHCAECHSAPPDCSSIMAAVGNLNRVAAYLARPGSGHQVPQQIRCGLFCSVRDAFDGKTIDFDALSVGRYSGSRTLSTARRASR